MGDPHRGHGAGARLRDEPSGQTITLGLWAAGAGGVFAFLSPLIGWLGVAVTGSDTSLERAVRRAAGDRGQGRGLDPTLMAAANSSGGVLGKMISPQNLAIGAAAVGMAGQEGDLFRKVLSWSLVLVLIMCVLVYLQSTASSTGWSYDDGAGRWPDPRRRRTARRRGGRARSADPSGAAGRST